MAKKMVRPKNEAIPLGTKKATAKKAAAPKKTSKTKATKEPPQQLVDNDHGPNEHLREAKPSEMDLLVKRRAAVVSYFMQTAGMDEATAAATVDSMDAETVDTLYTEAAAVVPPAAEEQHDQLVPDEEDHIPDFTETKLVESEEFLQLLIECASAAETKGKSEKEYKEKKKKIDAIMARAGIDKDSPVMALDYKLERYTGKSPKVLDPLLLVEKGVSIDIINKCYKQSEYDDVRITPPPKPKPEEVQ